MAIVHKYIMPDGIALHQAALVNLVERQEGSNKVKYVATRIYDYETDAVTDVVLPSGGCTRAMTRGELGYAMWSELPMLDVKTKQLVGKNKDRYCTLISARVFAVATTAAATARAHQGALCSILVWDIEKKGCDALEAQVLGFTFMDINGDKRYMTAAQVRRSDILQHTHSTSMEAWRGGLYTRRSGRSAKTDIAHTPVIEVSDVDTSVEDEEVAQMRLYKVLAGGWATIACDGALYADRNAVEKMCPEELEVPDGVLSIPYRSFWRFDTVKRIKLPESVQLFGWEAFHGAYNLEDVNIPLQVKELRKAFMDCMKLNSLDLSHIERLTKYGAMSVKQLVMPDVLQENQSSLSSRATVLEFRDMQGAKRRVLKSLRGVCEADSVWEVGRIETNGPVVLGDYKVRIDCTDVSALESNIIGIAPDCSFHKVDAEGNPLPWLFGPTTEFIYYACLAGYSITEAAYAANKLRAAYVTDKVNTELPKSVEILQGSLSASMCNTEYPNVVYATLGLYKKSGDELSTPAKLPSLRWVLPTGKTLTEAQIKRAESKLTPILPKICKRTQELFKLDLMQAENLEQLKGWLLSASDAWRGVYKVLFNEYGMVYVGDYGAALGN